MESGSGDFCKIFIKSENIENYKLDLAILYYYYYSRFNVKYLCTRLAYYSLEGQFMIHNMIEMLLQPDEQLTQ